MADHSLSKLTAKTLFGWNPAKFLSWFAADFFSKASSSKSAISQERITPLQTGFLACILPPWVYYPLILSLLLTFPILSKCFTLVMVIVHSTMVQRRHILQCAPLTLVTVFLCESYKMSSPNVHCARKIEYLTQLYRTQLLSRPFYITPVLLALTMSLLHHMIKTATLAYSLLLSTILNILLHIPSVTTPLQQ